MSFANIPWPNKGPDNAKVEKVKQLSQMDLAMLQELLAIFNRDLISFYTHHDFQASFRDYHWKPLSIFVDTWDDVTHEFLDEELESYKKQLYAQSLNLASIISKYTTSDGYGIYSVYPRRIVDEALKERFRAEGREINSACPAFVEECETFVRYARRRLAGA